jgi:long-subunit fatty acid transport protein
MTIPGTRTLVALLVFLGSAGGAKAQLVPNLGGQRAGISAFQSLKLGVGARGSAMGESFVAIANDASALYWNPAGLVLFSENQAFAAHTDYVVDISQEFFGIVYHLSPEDAVGGAVSSLHMAQMEITTETQPGGTGRYFTFGDVTAAVTYSRKMTDQFSFGATLRYAEETLDVLKMRSFMVDIGTLYWTGIGSTRFAVVISNFGNDVKPKGSVRLWDGSENSVFQSFSLPTMFRFGVAFEPIQTEEQRLTASLQLNHPNDNSEHFRLGLEWAWHEVLFLRVGIKRTIGQRIFGVDETSDEGISLGTGFVAPLAISKVSADYAFVDYSRLGSVHRFSLAFSF